MEAINVSNTTDVNTSTTTTTDVTTTTGNSVHTVVGSDAPSNYYVASRSSENPTQLGGSGQAEAPPGVVFGGMSIVPMKKKRGRPRKYAQDGAVAGALSPEPISSLRPPPVIDFSAEKRAKVVRPPASVHKQYQPRVETESLCNVTSYPFQY